jgi:hypothetical protein
MFASALALGAAALTFAGSASAQPAAPAAHAATPHLMSVGGPAATSGAKHDYRRACPVATRPGQLACMVLYRTNVTQKSQRTVDLARHAAVGAAAAPTGVGFGPASLQSAYKLPSSTAGSGKTVAIVDAMDDPNAASDLATYRSDWGLPACGTGCFSKVNQNGATSPLPAASGSSGWATEESLDIDMVSAICPLCHIILVEANSASTANLGTSVNSAVTLGAGFVSNSYGGSESTSDPTFDTSYYKHPGVAVTASAGDSGFGVEYPAASQFVTAVGGTSLKTSTNTRGWTETVWGSTAGGEGTGSGCSKDDAKPTWQTDTGCAKRTNNDVSADADPNTGVAVYDTYDQGGWLEVGGTSASSPMIAATFALAGTPAAGTYPSSYLYKHTSNLFDVTSGADGTCSPTYLCTAATGYDGPTGLGTPNGVAAFTGGATTGNTVTVTNPGSQTGTVGTAASLQIKASDSATGQTLTYSAAGLPAGLSISSATGLITGTPTAAATSNVTVTVKDTTGATGSASFSWVISAAGGGGGCTAAQLLVNQGFETGAITPWTSTSGVLASTSDGVPSHAGSWLAWLDGYGASHTDTLSQSATIPATCKTASLSFWLEVQTNAASAAASDTFKIQVLNSGGTVLATLGTFSNKNSSTSYVQHTFSLTPYIGQKITVKFTGTETLGGGDNTSFFDDDNALNVS